MEATRKALSLSELEAGQLFANVNVPGFYAVIRNLMFKFISRLEKSENVIIICFVKIGVGS